MEAMRWMIIKQFWYANGKWVIFAVMLLDSIVVCGHIMILLTGTEGPTQLDFHLNGFRIQVAIQELNQF